MGIARCGDNALTSELEKALHCDDFSGLRQHFLDHYTLDAFGDQVMEALGELTEK
ncbi:hypothetical protein OAE61_03410 [Verrucomicrobiales bacterium]|nr:hypothetical protein [Verrucomicrobiales bacterium]